MRLRQAVKIALRFEDEFLGEREPDTGGVGLVTVNEVIVPTAHPGTPFGGRRDSGWGVTQGAEGLLEMTVPQVVSTYGSPLRLHYRLPDGVGPRPSSATGNGGGGSARTR